jgi:2-phospho-L-lactate transferase/gluconeogenesis factor (CofD/UPF0052 family)
MVGQNTVTVTDILSVDLLYSPGNLLVDLLPLLRQDGIVDHLSCEGVLEDVGAVGIDAPFIEELGVSQRGEVG